MPTKRIIWPIFSALSILISTYSFAADYEAGFQLRAKQITEQTAHNYNPPSINIGDPEKYYWPKAMARFQLYGPSDTMANRFLETFHGNSPFHFTLVGMARIMELYKKAPMMEKYRKTYLQKVFERTDSYNAFTAEGTENHIAMSRTSGYLYCQYALQHGSEFPMASSKFKDMDTWLRNWGKIIFTNGTAEWNSGIYETYNLIGWLNVYDFATDPEMKAIARAVCDYYAAELALNNSYGLLGGSEMRGNGIGNGKNSATAWLIWLWFGEGDEKDFKESSEHIQIMHAITSTYRPPAQLVALARKQIYLPAWYHNSKPDYPMVGTSFIHQNYYIGKSFTLGAAYLPYGGWSGTSSQIVPWKAVFKGNGKDAPLEMSGNGRYYNNWAGKIRNPFTEVIQHKNVLIQMTKTPTNAKEIQKQVDSILVQWNRDFEHDFKKRFPTETYKLHKAVVNGIKDKLGLNEDYISFSKGAKILQKGNIAVVSFGSNFIGIQALNQNETEKSGLINNKNQELNTLIDKAPPGQICGFVIEIVEASKYENSAEKFFEYLKNLKGLDKSGLQSKGHLIYKSTEGNLINANYTDSGSFTEPAIDWGYGFTEQTTQITTPPYRQPEWPKGKGHGKIARWSVNRKPVNLLEPWPVYEGPNLSIKNGKMLAGEPGHEYLVDFTGKVPVFKSK